ncbi:thioredoxin family protein [Leptospira levettii]|uniref:HNH endonuclease n=1 Tax=Leptospira levettii TaxID=2023178 RepID=UPI00223D4E21|nr:hypothetical protein [Leptospira levettii]MCW7506195.1 thioredoxin family protein [Leptospira levettii]MCW7517285.1 thioredoxin family protein [Leptospira levettii]
MKNLKKLTIDENYFYLNIIKSKHRKRKHSLSILSQIVKNRYEEFEQLVKNSDLSRIKKENFTLLEKEALLHLYNQPTIQLNNLKKEIKRSQCEFYSTHCPYCGLYHSDTFDHYLYKEEFPEFAIYSQNLIPSCSRCNRKKNTKWIKDSIRQYIYFYADKIPTVQFLFCSIAVTSDFLITRFYVDTKNCSNTIEKIIVENHFANLDLIEMYEENCNSFLSERKNTIKKYFSGTLAELKEIMKSDLEEYILKFGLNNWQSVLLDELIKQDDILSTWI